MSVRPLENWCCVTSDHPYFMSDGTKPLRQNNRGYNPGSMPPVNAMA